MSRQHRVQMLQAGVSDVGGDVQEIAHRIDETIENGRVRTRVKAIGKKQRVPDVMSSHPAVAGYLIQLDTARRATDHAERPITPLFKQHQDLPDQAMAACPQCDGDPAVCCELCNGSGAVLETVADAWFIDHAEDPLEDQ